MKTGNRQWAIGEAVKTGRTEKAGKEVRIENEGAKGEKKKSGGKDEGATPATQRLKRVPRNGKNRIRKSGL